MTGCGTGAGAGSTTCARNETGAVRRGGPLSGPPAAADPAARREGLRPGGEGPGFSRREFLGLLAASLPAAAGLPGCVLGLGGRGGEGRGDFAFGVIADAQYCDYEPAGTRYYRESLKKLPACVREFNGLDLEFVIHLGDFIDRDFASFARFLPLYDELRHPHYHLLGNHDFAVAGEKKAEVPAVLRMPARYYDFACRGWRFVVLDGNDVSLHGNLPGSEKYKRAMTVLEGLSARRARNARPWNGAVGEEQIAWLKGRLAAAEAAGERVVLFCHFPLFPPNDHNLWNDEEMMCLVESYDCVAAWINGHNHAGNYGFRGGVHYLTVHGMVETPDTTAYAAVRAGESVLAAAGRGREPDRSLVAGRRAGGKAPNGAGV